MLHGFLHAKTPSIPASLFKDFLGRQIFLLTFIEAFLNSRYFKYELYEHEQLVLRDNTTVTKRLAKNAILQRDDYPAQQKEALKLWVVLARCFNSLTQAEAPAIAAYDLTIPQFGVLEALAHLGPMKMCGIGGKLLMSGANVTGVVDRLEKKGLVSRVMDAEDRRTFLIHLTDAGSKLIAEIFPRHAATIERLTGCLTKSEKQTLTALLKKLGKANHHSY